MKPGSDRLAVAAVAVLLALPLRAEDTRACPAVDPPLARPSFGGQAPRAGWRVFRDPETGRLRPPTPAEVAELERAETEATPATESTPVFRVIEHPDGMKSVDLQGAWMQSVVVTRNADGSLSFRCGPEPAPAVPAAPVAQARSAHEEK